MAAPTIQESSMVRASGVLPAARSATRNAQASSVRALAPFSSPAFVRAAASAS